VIVDESGCDETPTGLDDASASSSESRELGIRADGDDPFSANGERLRARACGIRRPDARVADDHVGVLRGELHRTGD
jgi:hypothetical protein